MPRNARVNSTFSPVLSLSIVPGQRQWREKRNCPPAIGPSNLESKRRPGTRLRNENFPIDRSPTHRVGLLRNPKASRGHHLQNGVLLDDVHAQCDCFRCGNAGAAGRNSKGEAANGSAVWTTSAGTVAPVPAPIATATATSAAETEEAHGEEAERSQGGFPAPPPAERK
jgi:hypothetical protein